MQELGNKLNKILQADCLEYLKNLPDGCVDLCLLDPPYNISHAKWDKWKCQKEYVNWLGSVFLECQRVLKDNGSFYFWHNDFQQMAELQHWISQNTKFVFNSMISWCKPNFRCIAWKNKQESSNLRSWFNIQEYVLYYTKDDDAFKSIKEYMREEKRKLKEHKGFLQDAKFDEFINKLTSTSSVVSKHYFGDSQWTFPVEHLYKKMQTTGFFQKPYEKLRAEYEELRPRFNIQNGQDYNNVWYSESYNAFDKNKLHTCEKPQDLLQKIILTSSNENDIVLDCFAGSGSLAQACLETNRKFLCCERDEGYVKIANDRLTNWKEDLLRQDKWLNDRGVMDFESDIKEKINQTTLL